MTMLYRVLTTEAPPELDAELAVARPTWAVLDVRPSIRSEQALFSDLLGALGKRHLASYRGRAANHSEALAYAWLAAGPVEHLAVRGAHLLSPAMLRALCRLTGATGVTTWLLDELHVNDDRHDTRARLAVSDVTLDEFLSARRRSGTEMTEPVEVHFPAVPEVHFLGFLTTARRLLSDDQFNTILPVYEHALGTTQTALTRNPRPSEGIFAQHLHDISGDTSDMNKLTVLARGAQAGAFLAGWHAKVDIARFAQRGAARGIPTALAQSEWKKLMKVVRPADAAACVLAVIGYTVNEMAELQGDQVAHDGSTVTVDGQRNDVPTPGRHVLVAQHIYRNLVGDQTERFLATGPKDPENTARRLGALLHQVSRDTGVLLRARNSPRCIDKSTRWTHRLGVTLSPLVA